MRTTPDECAELGRTIASKLNAATGPTALFVPLRGTSLYAAEGQVFYDAGADQALFAALRESVDRTRVECTSSTSTSTTAKFARHGRPAARSRGQADRREGRLTALGGVPPARSAPAPASTCARPPGPSRMRRRPAGRAPGRGQARGAAPVRRPACTGWSRMASAAPSRRAAASGCPVASADSGQPLERDRADPAVAQLDREAQALLVERPRRCVVVPARGGVAQEVDGLRDRSPVAELAADREALLEERARPAGSPWLRATIPRWSWPRPMPSTSSSSRKPARLSSASAPNGSSSPRVPDGEPETTERPRDPLPVAESFEDLERLLERRPGGRVVAGRPRREREAAESARDAALVARPPVRGPDSRCRAPPRARSRPGSGRARPPRSAPSP